MNSISSQFSSIDQIKGQYLGKNNSSRNDNSVSQTSFSDILEAKKENVKFSKHASERLHDRQINLSTEQLERLNSGVSQAREKSINESLVMMDDLAFIVNVGSNTVITAINQGEKSSNQVFTNIDGAVII